MIDLDAMGWGDLGKGSRIEHGELEVLFGVPRKYAEYSLKLTKLKDQVRRALKGRGLDCTVASSRGALVVLTDEEAVVYNTRWFANRRRGLFRSQRQLREVDVRNLSAEARVRHHRAVTLQGREVCALKSIRRLPEPIAHTRITPVLPGA